MIGSFSSGANTSLVVKNGIQNYSSTVDEIITNGQILINLLHMIRSFASDTNASLVAKIETKDLTTSDGF